MTSGSSTCHLPLSVLDASMNQAPVFVEASASRPSAAFNFVSHHSINRCQRLCSNVGQRQSPIFSPSFPLTGTPTPGIPLTSGSTFYWTVVWWDADDIQSQDAMATFDTAPSSSDWARASWVSGYGNTALIRGEVSLSHNPVRARLYVASLGFADLYVNGRSASDTYFGNGWTAFCKRTLFTTVDVTAALIAGNNTIAASLAIGWADNVAYPPKTGCPSYPLPQVRLLLAVTYEDGSVMNWGSSTQMITGPSPVTNASIYNGEHMMHD